MHKKDQRLNQFISTGAILFILIGTCIVNPAVCQMRTTSLHDFSFYRGGKKQKLKKLRLSIMVNKDTIDAVYTDSGYLFPILDSTQKYSYLIQTKGINFKTDLYDAWKLNQGSTLEFGCIDKLKKLISIAEYNGMTPNDDGYEWYSKRYFLIRQRYTLDIEDIDKISTLLFLVVVPRSYGDGTMTISHYKILKSKNKK